jgi:hypothetical protein
MTHAIESDCIGSRCLSGDWARIAAGQGINALKLMGRGKQLDGESEHKQNFLRHGY